MKLKLIITTLALLFSLNSNAELLDYTFELKATDFNGIPLNGPQANELTYSGEFQLDTEILDEVASGSGSSVSVPLKDVDGNYNFTFEVNIGGFDYTEANVTELNAEFIATNSGNRVVGSLFFAVNLGGGQSFDDLEFMIDVDSAGELTWTGTWTVNNNITGSMINGDVTAILAPTPVSITSILDKIKELKSESWYQVSDRPVRISVNAPLAQAIQYRNIAAANYRRGKFSIGNRYLKLVINSINKYKKGIERAISKNKFFPAEVESNIHPLLYLADCIIEDTIYLMDYPE